MPWCPRCGTGISQHEMTEGYQDREDPGLTVRFPLVDRPGESLLVWTTTPWTLAANVAAAVGDDLEYVRIAQGADSFWLSRGTLKSSVQGRFEVVESKRGSELVGWRYTGPYDALPAAVDAFGKGTRADPATPYEHRVVAWDQVGEDEGTGIVHIAPGAGAEDFQLGKSLGLPVIGPIDEDGRYYAGFGWLTGKAASEVAEEIVDDLERRGFFYHLAPYSHRYPHCWRCQTPLLFRLVDEWFISMGEVYDQPRDTLTKEQVDASLRYQIMEVVDKIRWIPSFGYERELDWLLNMHDWMISKKRYWGLALPIYDCPACGAVRGHRRPRRAQGAGDRGLGQVRGPHAASAVHRRGRHRVPRLRRAGPPDPRRRQSMAGRGHRAVLDAPLPRGPRLLGEVVPGGLHQRELPGPVPQLVLRDARDVDRAHPPAAVRDHLRLRHAVRRGRPADAQELGQLDRVRRGGRADGRRRHALDVHVGPAGRQHPVRLARGGRRAARAPGALERLRVLRDLRPPGGLGTPARGSAADRAAVASWPALDRWILSRAAGLAADVGSRLADYDPVGGDAGRPVVHR